MKLEFENPVCHRCGSNLVFQHHQIQVEGRRWTTKKERDADPNLKISDVQQTMWVSDPTWYTCEKCKQDIPPEDIEKAWEDFYTKCPELRDWTKWKYFEELGEAIGNTEAISRVDFK